MENVKNYNIDNSINLAGIWGFSMDREDIGIEKAWYKGNLDNKIKLPGILQAQGYGDDISLNTQWNQGLYDRLWFLRKDYEDYVKPGNVKVPFLSQPQKHYLGVAWYQRNIEIPESLKNKRIVLNLERPHWKTTIWIDDVDNGSCESLCAPHIYDLGRLSPGNHKITIRIDNRMLMPYRPDTHSVSDAVGNSWNGIAGQIKINATSLVWLDDVEIYPDIENKKIKVKITIGNISGCQGNGTLYVGNNSLEVKWGTDGTIIEYEFKFDEEAKLWDEFNPSLQNIRIKLIGNDADDVKIISYGLRQLKVEKTEFTLNNKKVYFRGTHDGGCFPITGYPATDVDSWKKIIRICKTWGLNFIRFHSWCPPEAAFNAADELGFYLQPECGMWNCFEEGSEMEKWLYDETKFILKAYGNHPSFIMLSPSNEPSGNWMPCLTKWVLKFRDDDSRRLYTAQSGWPWPVKPGDIKGTDYLYVHRTGFGPKGGTVRGVTGWHGGDYKESLTGVKLPVIVHELGQWCSYPDYEIINKFKGYLRPCNYEIFRDSMDKHGLLSKNKDFANASGKLQIEMYKEEIEANLRTTHINGFELLDIHDYLGQGTALVGFLDAFWEEKGYVSSEKFTQFCSSTVPLVSLSKRIFNRSETMEASLQFAHYGMEALSNVTPYFKVVTSSGNLELYQKMLICDVPIGKNTEIGKIVIDLSSIKASEACTLEVGIEGSPIKNSWDFWVYDEKIDDKEVKNVKITKSVKEAESLLLEGENVLYLPMFSQLNWNCPQLVSKPIFWNKHMGPTWGRSLGLWCDKNHAAFKYFPTQEYQNWQWSELVDSSRGINLEGFPKELQPIVQPIDDWNRNYKLGMIFEGAVGNGKLLVCSADIENKLDERPAARQLRYSLLKYMESNNFKPDIEIDINNLKDLLFDTLVMEKAYVKGSSDFETQGFEAKNAVDGDPNTFWFSGGKGTKHPYEYKMEFPKVISVNGLVYMPRQNHRDHQGEIKQYSVEVSFEKDKWQELISGEFESSFEPKKIIFNNKEKVLGIKLIVLSGFGADDVYYWDSNSKEEWDRHNEKYEDNTVAIANLAIISDEIFSGKIIDITYKTGETASIDIEQ